MSVPAGWTEVSIGDVTQPVAKRIPSDDPGQEFTYIDISSIEDQAIRNPKRLLGEDAPSRARQAVKAGDTLLSTVRTYLKNTALVPDDLDDAVASTGFCVLRPSADVHPRFLFHRVLEQGFVDELSRQQTGSSYPAVRDPDIRSMPVALPPLAEQQWIVAAIEEQFSRLHAAEGYLRRTAANLLGFRASVVSDATRGSWPEATIAELTASDRRSAYGVLQPGKHVEGGVPMVRVTDIVGGSIRTGDLKQIDPAIAARYPRTQLVGGEVVLTIVGTVGRTAVVPESLAGANVARAVAVIPLDPSVNPQFLSLALSSPRLVSQLVGLAHEVARKTLNLEDVRQFKLPVPPREEQDTIVRAVDAQMSIADAVMMEVRTSLVRTATARKAILREAFAGRLVRPSHETAIEGVGA
jgi:type I restriction enzyme S subunit